MYIKINGIELYYEEYGDTSSRPMIFLHGNGGRSSKFERTRDFFICRRSMIFIDSRGHGGSFFDGRITIPMMACDVAEFIKAKKLKDVALIGFSDGGNIALEAAAILGDTVKKLVVVGANTRLNGLKASAAAFIKAEYLGFCLAAPFSKKYKELKKHFEIMVKQPEISDEKLSKITAEALVVAGENDVIRDAHTREIAAKIKGARLEIVEGGDHFLFKKKNPEINAIIKNFVEG
ncbi:MAG: alpha/beta hydrolase [Clostridiales bacterium]|jgi:pimeloyl-ACP methyl ester carboxylesterase|nr:alpha/beta hydrolase [Clostridiales bacterium]